MEIPSDLKNLYRHWPYHIHQPKTNPLQYNTRILNQIKSFAIERQRIWEKKVANNPPPFTADPILTRYRFCNIYRELDRETINIHQLLNPLRPNFPLWLLNLALCRFICNSVTVKKIGLLTFNPIHNSKIYQQLCQLPSPKYGTAYVFPVSAIQRSPFSTREKFFCLFLPTIITQCASKIETFRHLSVVEALQLLLPIFTFNFRFHWTEILIDITYQFPQFLDLYQAFPIGPGSLPTMLKLSASAPSENTCLSLVSLNFPEFPFLEFNGQKIYLSSENWEGIGCEFRKYQNLQQGIGRHRLYD
ncbi:MAG: nucleotide kinase domain-containing protein [Candidatus Shapirobacteria bacterium]